MSTSLCRESAGVAPALVGVRVSPGVAAEIRAYSERQHAALVAEVEASTQAPLSLTGPLMLVACAWCRTPLDAVACAPSMAGHTSHGICPACRDQLLSSVGSRADGPGRGNPACAGEHAVPGGPATDETFYLVDEPQLGVWARLQRSAAWAAAANMLLERRRSRCRWVGALDLRRLLGCANGRAA
jgi:hypothetical protein